MSDTRISVIGPNGAGKTFLAGSLSQNLGVPVFHLDKEYWLAGWTHPNQADWNQAMSDVCAGDNWIIDGNYLNTIDSRLNRSTIFVFVQRPSMLRSIAVTLRTLRGLFKTRPDMPYRDRLSFAHLVNSFLYMRRNGARFEKVRIAFEQRGIPWVEARFGFQPLSWDSLIERLKKS